MIEKIKSISRTFENPNKTALMYHYEYYWNNIYDNKPSIYIQI
jgi:hypothetical protein